MTTRETFAALFIASAIPVGAALGPGVVPWVVVLLAFVGWVGLWSPRAATELRTSLPRIGPANRRKWRR